MGVPHVLRKSDAYFFCFDFDELRASLGDNLTTLPLREMYTGQPETDMFVDGFRDRKLERNFGALFKRQSQDIFCAFAHQPPFFLINPASGKIMDE